MDVVKLYFDPHCPWCFQTSRWARRIEELGLIELDWGLYSLDYSNLAEGDDPIALADTSLSAPALRSAWLMGQKEDSRAMGRLYKALGRRTWETAESTLTLEECVRESITEAGFDASLYDEALADPATWLGVLEDHRHLIEDKKAIGVPTIALDAGQGQAIFGPVISILPDDDEARELWEHTRWLLTYPNFAELKRNRFSIPQLPNQTLWRRRYTR